MFEVMYTAQITKVKKTWHDGLLTFNPVNKRCTLLDESNNELAADFTKAADLPIAIGSELRVGKYMITVESESDEQDKVSEGTKTKPATLMNRAKASSLNSSRRPSSEITDRPYRAPGLTAHKRARVGAAAFSVRLLPGKRAQQDKVISQKALSSDVHVGAKPQASSEQGKLSTTTREDECSSNNKRRSAGSILSLLDKAVPEVEANRTAIGSVYNETPTCSNVPDVSDVFGQEALLDTTPHYSKRLAIPTIPTATLSHLHSGINESATHQLQQTQAHTHRRPALRRDFQAPKMCSINDKTRDAGCADDADSSDPEHSIYEALEEGSETRTDDNETQEKSVDLIQPSKIQQNDPKSDQRMRAIPSTRAQQPVRVTRPKPREHLDKADTRLQSFFDLQANENVSENTFAIPTEWVSPTRSTHRSNAELTGEGGARMHSLYNTDGAENEYDDGHSDVHMYTNGIGTEYEDGQLDAEIYTTGAGTDYDDGQLDSEIYTTGVDTEDDEVGGQETRSVSLEHPVDCRKRLDCAATDTLTGLADTSVASPRKKPLSALEKLIRASKPSVTHTQNTRPVSTQQPSKPDLPVTHAPVRGRPFKPVIANAKAKRKFEFPSSEELQSANGTAALQRELTIPADFDNVMNYKQHYESMLYEHVNILIRKIAVLYHKALSQMDCSLYDPTSAVRGSKHDPNAPSCQHGKASSSIVKKEGKNQGRAFWHCAQPRNLKCNFFQWEDASDTSNALHSNTSGIGPQQPVKKQQPKDATSIENVFRKYHTVVFVACTVTRSNQKKRWYNKGKDSNISNLVDLMINRKESHSMFSKNDLWALCSTLDFDKGVVFARSAFYGPNADGTIELRPMEANGIAALPHGAINAIHLGNHSNELACLDVLREATFTPPRMPILPYLLNGSNSQPLGTGGALAGGRAQALSINLEDRFETVEHHALKYTLNADQAHALRSCAEMFSTADAPALTAPVTVVNGAFGSGKSYWLAVLVIMLVQLFEQSDVGDEQCADGGANHQRRPWKILISSNTNVAVDRVLTLLLSFGFNDFVRVGSVKKMARNILPHRIQSSGTKAQDMKDLKELLKSGDLSDQDVRNVKESIKVLKAGADADRLAETRVVGVTCAATVFPCLQPFSFPVVLLDESSQLTEPQAWLPIVPFGVEKLVLVGDHRQLPPTIQTDSAPEAQGQGLEYTLFERLARDHPEDVVPLYTQYRCHPSISAISNRLFYHNALSDAVSGEDRQPLVERLPTLCFYDVPNGASRSQGAGNSLFNKMEAEFASHIVQTLVGAGVAPDDIGVVTLYRAQAQRIRALLSDEAKRILVSTVDAFQGGEREVIVLSCVMTGDMSGFVDSFRRTNVAITRARRHLLILGNARALSRTKLWADVIQLCEEAHGSIERASDQFSVGKLIEESTPISESEGSETIEDVRERLQLTVRNESAQTTSDKRQPVHESDMDAEFGSEHSPPHVLAVPRTDSESSMMDEEEEYLAASAITNKARRRAKPKPLPDLPPPCSVWEEKSSSGDEDIIDDGVENLLAGIRDKRS